MSDEFTRAVLAVDATTEFFNNLRADDEDVTFAESVAMANVKLRLAHIAELRAARSGDRPAEPSAPAQAPNRPNHLERRLDVVHVLVNESVPVPEDSSNNEIADVIVADLERVPMTNTRRQVAVVADALSRRTTMSDAEAEGVAESVVMRLNRSARTHGETQPAGTWRIVRDAITAHFSYGGDSGSGPGRDLLATRITSALTGGAQ